MDGLVLTLLTVVAAALPILGVLGGAWPRHSRHLTLGAAALALLAACLAMIALLSGGAAVSLVLPLGLPGMAFRLVLDPLAAFFALLLFGTGAATLLGTITPADAAPDAVLAVGPLAIGLAGLELALLAGGGLACATGLAVAGVALWALQAPDETGVRTDPSPAPLGVALFAAASIVAVGNAPPATLRWLIPALLGPGALAGLVPLHAWLPAVHRSATPAGALLSGAIVPVGLAVMLRLLFVPGVVAPAWWGLPPLLLGALSVLAGGWSATLQPDLDTALAAGTVRLTGLSAIGIGIALTARANDLPGIAAMALGAVLLLAALQAICGTLLPLTAGAIRHGTGTRRLDRLGGLVHRMPHTTACLLAGLFAAAALPPSAGFAALWLLFQSLVQLPHAGHLPFQLLICALAGVLGLAAALAVAGLTRLVGMVCLGRPRTPRAAVGDEPPRLGRRVLLTLAGVSILAGMFVGPLLSLLADPAIRMLTGSGLGQRATWLGLSLGAESPGYAALPIASLLLLTGGLVLWVRRLRGASRAVIGGPAWDGGFSAPPAWLPFGDPTTQSAGTGFAPLIPMPPAIRAGRIPDLFRLRRAAELARGRGHTIALLLAAALLAFCAWSCTT